MRRAMMRTAYRSAIIIIGELGDEGSGNHPYTANKKGVIDHRQLQ